MKTLYKISLTSIFLLLAFTTSYAQNIEGIVNTNENIPLEAANVVIKGTTSSTTTDQNGRFSIDSKGKLPITLLVQYVGYKTTEIEITALPTAPLQLVIREENELIEVVVSSRRRIEKVQDVPIAVSVITGKQAEHTGAFIVDRSTELVRSVELYSSNP